MKLIRRFIPYTLNGLDKLDDTFAEMDEKGLALVGVKFRYFFYFKEKKPTSKDKDCFSVYLFTNHWTLLNICRFLEKNGAVETVNDLSFLTVYVFNKGELDITVPRLLRYRLIQNLYFWSFLLSLLVFAGALCAFIGSLIKAGGIIAASVLFAVAVFATVMYLTKFILARIKLKNAEYTG